MAKKRTTPEQPRTEPEIIPPDRSGRRSTWYPDGYAQAGGTHRLYVARVGPFGFALLMLAVAALAAVILLVILGAVLLWIPIVAVAVIAAAIFGRFHR
jgi:hypothetical protein